MEVLLSNKKRPFFDSLFNIKHSHQMGQLENNTPHTNHNKISKLGSLLVLCCFCKSQLQNNCPFSNEFIWLLMRPGCKNTVFSFILAKISQLYDPTLVWFYCWIFIKSLLTLSFPIQADSSCTLMTYIENSCRERYQDGHQVNWHALKGLCHASNIHHGTSHRDPRH